MQSVVTGQAPIALERKKTSGGKTSEKRKIIPTINWNKSYTSEKKVERRDRRTIRTYQDAYHMLNESQQKPKPRRQHSSDKKKTEDATNDVQIEIEFEIEKRDVVFTLNRSFYPRTSAVPPVPFLILHPREIQILWSQAVRQRKTNR